MERPLVVIARMRAQDGKSEELHRALLDLATSTREEPGCLTYDLHIGADDPQLFAFYEVWRNEAALAAHDDAPHIHEFQRRIPHLVDGTPVVERLWPAPDTAP